MRFEIKEFIDNDWNLMYDILNDLNYEAYRISNRAINLYWDIEGTSYSFKQKYEKFFELTDVGINLSPQAYIASELKKEFAKLNTSSVETINMKVKSDWGKQKKDVFKGDASLTRYRRDRSNILARSTQIKLERLDKREYKVNIRLLNKDYAKWLFETGFENTRGKGKNKETYFVKKNNDGMWVSFKIKAHDNNQLSILENLVDGNYKLGTSQFIYNKRKNKWLINLTYSFETVKQADLDENNIMGIDMGIVYPVYMAFNNNLNRYNVEGGEIEKFRKGIQARRNALLKQGKYCGEGRRGHGRVTRLKPIQKLEGRVEDFKKTTNHKYSKYVIEMAIKHNCGTIQMEDLSGIADGEKKSTFLGNWTYYDLQQKITYKAEKAGIKVVKIKPDYTSQRCSKCGNIHKENRDAKKDQSKFKCVTCGFEANADFNAARNIATKDIEKIIQDQLKAQEKALKHAMKYEA